MASTSTGSTSSTGPSTGSNRTKLDKLKAELQGQVGDLRDKLICFQEFLLDEEFAQKRAKFVYIALLGQCSIILTGENPTDSILAQFKAHKAHFANMLESKEGLRSPMDQCVLPC